MKRINASVLATGLSLLLAVGAVRAEPNDDFSSATALGPGVLTAAGEIFGGLFPDTTLGAFDEFGAIIEIDDDSGSVGTDLSSALFGIPVNTDGSIELAVSGFPDFDFDGIDDDDPPTPHFEVGEYEVLVTVFDAGGVPIDGFSEFGELLVGTADFFFSADAGWVGGRFDVEVDNTISDSPGDIDFYRFSGLDPSLPFAAEIVEGDFDTVLGWFDPSTGDLLADDDDGGDGTLSLITGGVPASGEIVLAVTGFDDFGFQGLHAEFGEYTLVVSQIPEPASAVLLAGLLFTQRRR
ncbi:MAG: hypothetical protein AAFV43_09770 [Planctomycetota bacterium]